MVPGSTDQPVRELCPCGRLTVSLTYRLACCRYYGKSKPFPPKELRQNMKYLSADQALVRTLCPRLQMVSKAVLTT